MGCPIRLLFFSGLTDLEDANFADAWPGDVLLGCFHPGLCHRVALPLVFLPLVSLPASSVLASPVLALHPIALPSVFPPVLASLPVDWLADFGKQAVAPPRSCRLSPRRISWRFWHWLPWSLLRRPPSQPSSRGPRSVPGSWCRAWPPTAGSIWVRPVFPVPPRISPSLHGKDRFWRR